MRVLTVKTGWIFLFILIIAVSITAMGLSQDNSKRARRLYDIEEQLTCSKSSPVKMKSIPSTVPVDYYRVKDDVWVNISQTRMAGEEAWLFVVNVEEGKKLKDGDALVDVSGVVERVFLEKGPDRNIHRIWEAPLDEGEYNVVVDFSPFGIYNRGGDLLDDISTTGVGFRVAVPWIDYIRIDPLEGNNVFEGGCTRLQGTGISQYWERYYAYAWRVGENGIPEDGGGDDVNAGQISPAWSTDVPYYLGEIGETGVFLAAIDYRCGEGLIFADFEIEINGNMVTMSDTATIVVIPPDWVPGDSSNILVR
jgi:hypothetical protein